LRNCVNDEVSNQYNKIERGRGQMLVSLFAAIFTGLILSEYFAGYVLIPTCVLLIGFDIAVRDAAGRAYFGLFELIALVTSIQLGYFVGVVVTRPITAAWRRWQGASYAAAHILRAVSPRTPLRNVAVGRATQLNRGKRED
jgi:hypothetical protein